MAAIQVTEKAVFPATAQSWNCTSDDLCSSLHGLFGEPFKDFFGFSCELNLQTRRLLMNAVFMQTDRRENCAFMANTDANGNLSPNERITRITSQNPRNNAFKMTKDAQEMIEPFMDPMFKKRNLEGKNIVDWNDARIRSQQCQPNNNLYGNNQVYEVIHGIDPILLLKEIYGSKVDLVSKDDNESTVRKKVTYMIMVLGTSGRVQNSPFTLGSPTIIGTFLLDIKMIVDNRFKHFWKSAGFEQTGILGVNYRDEDETESSDD